MGREVGAFIQARFLTLSTITCLYISMGLFKELQDKEVRKLTPYDLIMLSFPIGSFAIGVLRKQLNNTEGFLFGFFCASLITLSIYAQTSDSGLTWLKV